MAGRQDQTHTTADFSRVTSPSSFFERRVLVETVIPFSTTKSDRLPEDPVGNIDTTIEDLHATVQNLNQVLGEVREATEGIHQILLEHSTRIQAHILELREVISTTQDYNNGDLDINDNNHDNLQDSDHRAHGSDSETDTSNKESVYLWYTFSSEASDKSWSSGVSDGSENSSSSASGDDSEDLSSSGSEFR
ncbi:hypothetical protein LTR84_004755 [Exophiala bonariae]|uniref:Uncharacterized protein n=1 Tax=Exophiala bonariae TaxID=1690606 RepID=A0AAV9NRP1_9EURO|nr:hypothetical protein LTR84_004755 [Exophiala bonariae]